MNSSNLLMGSLGAAGMYFFDPRLGRRRRAVLRDRLLKLARDAGHGAELGARDLAHRLRGLAAEGRHLVTDGDADDRVIEARVRAAMGRIVAHPRLVRVTSSGGIVLLSGPVAPGEYDALIDAVRGIRGVHGVDNNLQTNPALARDEQQHETTRTRPGRTPTPMQENWPPATRLIATLGGGWMAAHGLRRGGVIGAIESATGAALLLRGATNLDMCRLAGISGVAGGDEHRGIDVHKTINIRAGLAEVFGFFSNYDNFPLFMRNVREVRDRGDGHSHWVVAGPAGIPVTWDAILTDYQPNRIIAWESVGSATVGNAGVIRFDENPDGSTRVDIRLSYNPPGGVIAHAIASMLRADPKSEMDADLARLKTLIERGQFPHDAAQHASVMSPASPPITAQP